MGTSGTCGTRVRAHPRPFSGPARAGERGMSMVEAMIAMVVIAIALLALLSLISSAGKVQDDSRQRTLAYNAARQKLEEMRQLITPKAIYTYYNSGSANNWFRVDDLPAGTGPMKASTTDPTQPSIPAQGRVLFPESSVDFGVLENPADGQLRKVLGMPKDINGNGIIDTATVTADQILILPVLIRVEWFNKNGKTSNVEVVTFITSK